MWDWGKREKRDGFAAVGSAAGLEKEGKVKEKENVGRRREGLKAKGRTCGGCQRKRGEWSVLVVDKEEGRACGCDGCCHGWSPERE